MPFLQREVPRSGPQPHLQVLWAVSILTFCVLLQILVLALTRGSLGKNASVIASLTLGLILPAVIIVFRVSPDPRQTLRLNGISLRPACWITGASLCFTLLASSSVELALRMGKLPPQILYLLEKEEKLLREIFSFESAADLLMVALAVGVIAPIAEELLFRGLLQGSLERRLGNWPGLLLVGLSFGLLHGRLRFLPVGLLGILMGYMVMRTNSVLSGMLAHSCNNTLALFLAFPIQADPLPLSLLAASLLVGCSGLLLFLWLFRKSTRHTTRISKIASRLTPDHGPPPQKTWSMVHNHEPEPGEKT